MWLEGLGYMCLLGLGLLLFIFWTVGVFCIRPRPRSFYGIWLGVPVLALLVLVAVLLGVSIYHSLPSVVFRDSVGFDPPPDITIQNSLRHMPTKWDDSFLEFSASDATIHRILPNGFTSIQTADIIEYGNTPGWWQPPAGSGVRIYATNTNDPHFRDEHFRYFVSHRLMVYDPGSGNPSNRKVYFRYRRP